jgi:hypothetical protein
MTVRTSLFTFSFCLIVDSHPHHVVHPPPPLPLFLPGESRTLSLPHSPGTLRP